MSEEKKMIRPRMRKRKCIDLYTGEELSHDACLTKSGVEREKSATMTMIQEGQEYFCSFVEGTTFERKSKTISRKGYKRKAHDRPEVSYERQEKRRCPKKIPDCTPEQEIVIPAKTITRKASHVKATKISPTTFKVDSRLISKDEHWNCTKVGEKKEQ